MNRIFSIRIILIITLIVASFSIYSFQIQPTNNKEDLSKVDDEYANDSFIRYDDYIYNDSIKTVLLYNYKSQLSPSIIPLNGSNEHLILSFDDLRNDFREYNYSVLHCNADWTPSELQPNEYLSGFFENNITDFTPSFNTDLPYTHYNVEFPNEDFQFTRSGNYIITVFEEDKTKPILTKRFMVYESNVTININTKRATDVNDQFFKQEVDFSINHAGYDILDPFKSLNVVVMQNYRWDNAITGLDPRFIKDDELDYNYNRENVFEGNNEYRNFDIKSIQYQTIRVKRIAYSNVDQLKHVYLLDDENRSFKRYYSFPDINGNFLIKRNEGENSEIEADYVKVHFTLPNILPRENGNLYLFGKLSDWRFRDEFKLDYDTLSATYHKEVLLKQGFYDYHYCFVKDGSKNTGDLSIIEGSHSETENDYAILVYHRPANENYDKLIGYHVVNTNNQ